MPWETVDGKLVRVIKKKNFVEALALVNRIGQLAEAANHHPDICIRWNEVELTLWTHDTGTITERDDALAAQIDDLMTD